MEPVFLIVGLGNPGKKFRKTRHNLGFMVVDRIADEFQCSFKRKHWHFWETSFKYNNKKIILIKPSTYMNLSGKAVVKAVKKHHVVLSNILIISDDLNLSFGKLRIKAKGSAGGHNGLKSIISYLNTDCFSRLRIGISQNSNHNDVVKFVLSEFSDQERDELDSILKKAVQCVLHFIDFGVTSAMNKFNNK